MEDLNIVLIMSLLENLEKKVNDVDKRLKEIEDRFSRKLPDDSCFLDWDERLGKE